MIKQTLEISVPFIKDNSKKYLEECINSNFVSSVGPFVNLFENAIANILEIDPNLVTSTNSGTSALHLSLLASGIQQDDLVLIPSYTFIATANAVSNAGGVPWLIDVNSNDLTINTTLLESELEDKTYLKNGLRYHKELNKRIFGIIPVHVFGFSPDLDSIYKIAKRFNLKIICDAAGGLGSSYKNKAMGESIKNGIISFNGNKIITTGGGGIFFSENIELVKRVKHLASTARKTADYIHDKIGYNFRISNLHAALGLAQTEYFEYILKRKNEIAKIYKNNFKDNKNIFFINPDRFSISSNWLNAIIIKDKEDFSLEEFILYMQQEKINIRHYWRPIHLQPPYINCPKSSQEISSNLFSRIIVLPSSTGIRNDEINFVVKKLINFLND